MVMTVDNSQVSCSDLKLTWKPPKDLAFLKKANEMMNWFTCMNFLAFIDIVF